MTKACPHENGGMLLFLKVNLTLNSVFSVVKIFIEDLSSQTCPRENGDESSFLGIVVRFKLLLSTYNFQLCFVGLRPRLASF